MSNSITLPAYAIAQVIGFKASVIRVKVNRIDERSNNAWVVTADLADAGTPLTLDLDKIEFETDSAEALIHQHGLVVI